MCFLRACHQNRSIYEVLDLEARINVSEVLTFANNPGLLNAVDNIRQRLNYEGQIVILPDQARRKLTDLADSSPSIPFDTYTEVVLNLFIFSFSCYLGGSDITGANPLFLFSWDNGSQS